MKRGMVVLCLVAACSNGSGEGGASSSGGASGASSGTGSSSTAASSGTASSSTVASSTGASCVAQRDDACPIEPGGAVQCDLPACGYPEVCEYPDAGTRCRCAHFPSCEPMACPVDAPSEGEACDQPGLTGCGLHGEFSSGFKCVAPENTWTSCGYNAHPNPGQNGFHCPAVRPTEGTPCCVDAIVLGAPATCSYEGDTWACVDNHWVNQGGGGGSSSGGGP